MKEDCDKWQTIGYYSPFTSHVKTAEKKLRHGKLIGEELELRELRKVNEIADEENIKRLKNHNTEYIKTLKQTQETFVKTGAVSQTRKEKYLATRAQHYLKQTEQELQLREQVSQSIAIQPQEKPKPGCGDTTPIKPTPNRGKPGIPLEPGKPTGYYVPPVEMPKPLINVPPIEADHWSNHIHTQGKSTDNEKNKKSDKVNIAERAKQIQDRRRWTNKEAREHAEALGKGYEEKKNKPESIKGIGFTNGKNWISPDIDGHNGSVWKEFSLKGVRTGSLDKDLNRIKN